MLLNLSAIIIDADGTRKLCTHDVACLATRQDSQRLSFFEACTAYKPRGITQASCFPKYITLRFRSNAFIPFIRKHPVVEMAIKAWSYPIQTWCDVQPLHKTSYVHCVPLFFPHLHGPRNYRFIFLSRSIRTCAIYKKDNIIVVGVAVGWLTKVLRLHTYLFRHQPIQLDNLFLRTRAHRPTILISFRHFLSGLCGSPYLGRLDTLPRRFRMSLNFH